MMINELVEHIAALPGSDVLANPYAPSTDPGSAVRRENFARYLREMHQRQPSTVLVFEAPGYRGCRLSGIPVTSERIMLQGIEKWGLFGEGYRQTSGTPGGVAEMTATILWGALVEYAAEPPLIFNTVPLHPHQPFQPMSNRTPTLAEQREGALLIDAMLEVFRPARILAVGRVAQAMLRERGHDFAPLRHPSQGGKPEFVRGLRETLGK